MRQRIIDKLFVSGTWLADCMIEAIRDMYRPPHAAIQFFSNASVQFAIKCAAILLTCILVNGIAVQHSYRM